MDPYRRNEKVRSNDFIKKAKVFGSCVGKLARFFK
jgi:hypothetical protein